MTIMNNPCTQATQLKFIIIRDRIYRNLAFLKGKLVSCSTQLSMEFQLLLKTKMLKIIHSFLF